MPAVVRRELWYDVALGAPALALYLATLAPGLYTLDSAELAAGAHVLGIVHATGYPVYLLLLKAWTLLVPVGEIAYRANLFSAVCAVGGLVAFRRAMVALTGAPVAALAAAALLGVAEPLWSQALRAEVYTLHVLFLALILLLVVKWRAAGGTGRLAALGLLLGLSLGNHMATVLLLPGLGILLRSGIARARPPARAWLLMALGLAAGPLSYLYLPLRQAAHPPMDIAAIFGVDLATPGGFLWMVSGAMFSGLMFGYALAEIPGEILALLTLAWDAFLGVGLLVAVYGAWAQWQRDRELAMGLGAMAAATVIFFVNYRAPDKDTMFLPLFMMLAVWLGEGLAALLAAGAAVGRRRLTRRWLAVGATVLGLALLLANYVTVDLHRHHDTRDYAQGVFAEVAPDAFVMGAWVRMSPLLYLQVVEARRPDVMLFDWGLHALADRLRLRAEGLDEARARDLAAEEVLVVAERELLRGRPVYSLEDNLLLRERFELVRGTRVFRVCASGTVVNGAC